MDGLANSGDHDFSDVFGVDSSEYGLWQRWRDAGDLSARKELIDLFAPYARMLAAVIYKGRFHDEVEFSDYHQLACVGLLEAVDRFDPKTGVHFKTYAAHRIRGAVLNGLEKQTEKNQQIAAQQRLRKDRLELVKDAAKSLIDKVQVTTTDPVSSLLSYMAEVGVGLALGVMLEGTSMFVAHEEEAATVASPEVNYFKKSEALQLREILRGAIENLGPSEQRVVRYHYHQGLQFEEISQLLGVSRSRVSQIHRKALLDLQHALAQGPPCDIFL